MFNDPNVRPFPGCDRDAGQGETRLRALVVKPGDQHASIRESEALHLRRNAEERLHGREVLTPDALVCCGTRTQIVEIDPKTIRITCRAVIRIIPLI